MGFLFMMKKFFYGLCLVILAWLILFVAVLVIVSIAALVGSINLVAATVLNIVLWLAIPIIITLWVIDDAREFRDRGINTEPWLWGLGVFLLAGIFFPIYLIYRQIVWPERLGE
jgi:hypothetical protein